MPAGRHALATPEDLIEASLGIARRARRELLLLTRRLDADPCEHGPFLTALRALALARPEGPIRILVFDARDAARTAPRLLALAHRLPSRILLRRVGDDFQDRPDGFMVADQRAYLHRPRADRLDGFADCDGPREARRLSGAFEELWEYGESDAALRQLHL